MKLKSRALKILKPIHSILQSIEGKRCYINLTLVDFSPSRWERGSHFKQRKSLGDRDKIKSINQSFNYEGITIKVKREKSNFLDLLKKDLSANYAISATSSDLPSSSPTDALIIIGK